jgi:DNA adenine methylase
MTKPFLKWPGSKQKLLHYYQAHIPQRVKRLVEPCLGGGSFFFARTWPDALLNDVNGEVINCYRVVRDDVEGLITRLAHLEDVFNQLEDRAAKNAMYLTIRNMYARPEDVMSRAVRMLFLNRTCYNGLYRVSKKSGNFNVPLGRYDYYTICQANILREASQALQDVRLLCEDVEEIINRAELGDFYFIDPPYDETFDGYTSAGFDRLRQFFLRDAVDRLNDQNIPWIVCNADTPWIRELYYNYTINVIRRPGSINSDPTKRQPVNEVFITNIPSPAYAIAGKSRITLVN